LGERQSRVFDIALATEASNALARVFSPSKASRNQFQPETHDTSATMSNDVVNSSSKIVLAGTTKIAASVSALIVGAVIYGVTSLERVVNHSQIEGRPGCNSICKKLKIQFKWKCTFIWGY
jgi:hypothetical protein